RARIRRFGGPEHVDGDDQDAALGQPLVHQLVGGAVLPVPGAPMNVDQHRKGPVALWLVDARQERADRIAAVLDVPALEGDLAGWVVSDHKNLLPGVLPLSLTL